MEQYTTEGIIEIATEQLKEDKEQYEIQFFRRILQGKLFYRW